MTEPRRVSTRRAVLSYSQIKELNPRFKDLMVKDYQGILQDFAFTADEIDALEVTVLKNQADIVDLQARILRTRKVAVDTVAESFQVVLCDNTTPIVVTLNPDAVKDDLIHVIRRNDEVTTLGLIDGDNTGRLLNVEYWSELYIFDGTEWSVI